MESVIFLCGAVVFSIVFMVFIQWSERRDAKAAVREIQALRNAAMVNSFSRQAPPAPPARNGGGIEIAGS